MKKFIIATLILSLTIIALINYFTPTAEAATIILIINTDPEYTISPGDKLKLTVDTDKAVKWSSSNNAIASVSKKGVVTGNDNGSATITAKVGKKKYKCIVSVKNDEEDLQYLRDLAEREYINKFSGATLAPDYEVTYPDEDSKDNADDVDAVSARIKEILESGASSSEDLDTEIGKAYSEFCKIWVSEYELKNTYDVSTVWSWYNNKMYLLYGTNNKYIIEGTPDKFMSGTVYTNGEVQYQYLEKFEYNGESYKENQYYFSRKDLINKGIIKE